MPVDKKTKTRSNPYEKVKPEAGPSSSEVQIQIQRPGRPTHKIPTVEQRSSDAIPGLSKLKGQIRQTKRLLAKETLEPGLRVQTQRRLTSLEADLASALKRDVEKKNGAKYHMVKFFERQKLVRIIKRLNRKMKEEDKSEKKKSKLEEELSDARIMMNYVLNFPNSEKYISLFPPSSESDPTSASASTSASTKESKLTLPLLLHPTPNIEELDKPSKRRYEILNEISTLMKDGKLSLNPEDEVKKEKVNLLKSDNTSKATKGDNKVDEEEDDFFESD
ncbi:uncharacterized protein IL334_004925 [Kwoniella shivajii]|uniref:rRNA-processing protein EFG1 n=1 Tax=Kwoniella shivajii TaxID=564305 RepID=A0ABZ1D252_9TREE|nr:hypothetical protein IL334_004925 [Kwoniella shivajii]